MSLGLKQLYASANGDRWYLCYSNEGRAFVRHVPNTPSGGKQSDIELADFLRRNGNPPEQQALVRLIGGMTEGQPGPDV